MLPDSGVVKEPNHEKKCNNDNPKNRQYENPAGSMSVSAFIIHFGAAI
jgi:hypothetical protein